MLASAAGGATSTLRFKLFSEILNIADEEQLTCAKRPSQPRRKKKVLVALLRVYVEVFLEHTRSRFRGAWFRSPILGVPAGIVTHVCRLTARSAVQSMGSATTWAISPNPRHMKHCLVYFWVQKHGGIPCSARPSSPLLLLEGKSELAFRGNPSDVAPKARCANDMYSKTAPARSCLNLTPTYSVGILALFCVMTAQNLDKSWMEKAPSHPKFDREKTCCQNTFLNKPSPSPLAF